MFGEGRCCYYCSCSCCFYLSVLLPFLFLSSTNFENSNGGWQWSASTGTDSQPYLRIFNPLLQAERYDPDSTFIKRYVPELQSLGNNAKAIRDPSKVLAPPAFKKLGYPAPIVDHKVASKAFIALFKAATTAAPS